MEESPAAASAVPKRVVPPGSSGGGKQPPARRLLPNKAPSGNVVAAKPAVRKAPSGFKGTIPKRPWLSASISGSAPAAKQAGLVPGATTSASKKLPGSAALLGAARKPVAASVPLVSPAPGRLGTSIAAPSQPNSQIRQNIRRSLKEILWKRWAVALHFLPVLHFKWNGTCRCSGLHSSSFVPRRVSDSDDLVMTENDVGKIALRIEKEMFGLFHVTDNRYKSKYRSLMFNLKDPKNQVCTSGFGLVALPQKETCSLVSLTEAH